MEIGLLLIIVGIVVAILLSGPLGLLLVLVGLALILVPRLRAGGRRA